MYFLHAIKRDRQTRVLNVFGQIAMTLGDKKIINFMPLWAKEYSCMRTTSIENPYIKNKNFLLQRYSAHYKETLEDNFIIIY